MDKKVMDLQSLFHEHHIPFGTGGSHRNVRDGWIGIDCPWCDGTGSGRYHLGIHPDTHASTCWRCGPKRLGDVLARLLRIPLHQAITLLGEVPKSPRIDSKAGLRRGVFQHPPGLGPLLEPHLGYLRGRGFDPGVLERLWGLKGIGIAPRLGWRIWIPVLLNGEVVSWTTRTIGNKTASKYIHAKPEQEAVPIKHLLYGIDYVRSSMVVCEGLADVWRIGPGAVAVMGLQITKEQIGLMGNVPKRFICFDNEPAAQQRAGELCRTLKVFEGDTSNVRLEANDPGEAGSEELAELRKLLEQEK